MPWGRTLALAFMPGLLAVCLTTQAQLRDEDPDWVELQTLTPPAYELDRQISFEIPQASRELKWGVDPKTISVGSDGVIRYVVMATSSSGSTNVFFEGINCARGEVKTYARVNQSGQWHLMEHAQWKGLNSGLPSRHALTLARTAFCDIAVVRTDLGEIVRLLKTGPVPVRNK
jgi:hypothetical protein